MGDFFREAGMMVFLMVVTGPIAVGWSIAFAYRPNDKKRRVTNAFLRATTFAGMFGFTAGMVNTLRASQLATDSESTRVLIEGTMESGNNLFLAFAFLSLAALFLAVGEARVRSA